LKISKESKTSKKSTLKSKNTSTASKNKSASTGTYPNSVSPNANKSSNTAKNFFIWVGIILAISYMLSIIFSPSSSTKETIPTSTIPGITVCNQTFKTISSEGESSLCSWLSYKTYPNCEADIRSELFARGQLSDPIANCGQKNHNDINFQILQLKANTNGDLITYSSVPSNLKSSYASAIKHINREFDINTPTKSNGLDIFKNLKINF
jgi:hypothetical protein